MACVTCYLILNQHIIPMTHLGPCDSYADKSKHRLPVWGSHGRNCEEHCSLECDAMNSSSYQCFGGTADIFFGVGDSYTLKMEAVVSSETLFMEYLSTKRHFLEDSNMQRAIVFIYGIKILNLEPCGQKTQTEVTGRSVEFRKQIWIC